MQHRNTAQLVSAAVECSTIEAWFCARSAGVPFPRAHNLTEDVIRLMRPSFALVAQGFLFLGHHNLTEDVIRLMREQSRRPRTM